MNSILKIMTKKKKKNNEMGEDVHGEIKLNENIVNLVNIVNF